MQRQSLGSPVSKLHSHGVALVPKDDSTLLSLPDNHPKRSKDETDSTDGNNNERRKSTKPPPSRRFSSSSISALSSSKPEKLVHFIPLLTLLCFLVLYLVSHTPSQSDLAQFNGFKQSSKHIDENEIGDVDRFGSDIRRGDALAIRNLMNLQEIADKRASSKSRIYHRKIVADF
ncbi:uncharacterized protein LOC8258770 [Ricinus communis]|uniref:Uncharacterized protein n=1 Tax=Ricinus communis TaxID=3988 RepID=B9SRC5_RICCO|nr:uncharacterized protein LOC8258770 [Ricinus communis]EEF33856.1 conserved hypothetical protein [Ricinus communis]|eukprot:XP_002528544.1 uncharacterized protein LOC8258770 [Ricinus communis]